MHGGNAVEVTRQRSDVTLCMWYITPQLIHATRCCQCVELSQQLQNPNHVGWEGVMQCDVAEQQQ